MPSSVVRAFVYDAPSRSLLIIFTSGRRYRYQDVPPEIHDAMRAAFSKGEFFNRHIKDHFAFTRET